MISAEVFPHEIICLKIAVAPQFFHFSQIFPSEHHGVLVFDKALNLN
jgi:hypothetical protein